MHGAAATVAAQVMTTLTSTLAGGVANFRFATAANIPAGTPFFPGRLASRAGIGRDRRGISFGRRAGVRRHEQG